MKPVDLLIAVVVMLIWGLNFPIAKIGLQQLPPILMMALRFALVAALICPFRRLPRDKLKHALLLSVTLGGVHFSLMFSGLARTDAATASLLIQSQVPFAALLAAAFFGDRITRRLVVGMLIAFGGVALIAGEPRFGADPTPILLILAASFAWAVANIQFKLVGAVDPVALSGWLALFCTPQLLLATVALEQGQIEAIRGADWRGWSAVLYAAIFVTILSYGMWYPLMRKYPVNLVMPFTLLVPVFGVASGVLMLGDALTWRLVAGGLATLLGVATIALRRPAAART